jgi:hypothetical protein
VGSPFIGADVVYCIEGENKKKSIVVWNTRERRTVATLEGFSTIHAPTPDSKFWVAFATQAGKPHGDAVIRGCGTKPPGTTAW